MKFSYLFLAVITLSLLITPSSGRIGNTEANNAATFLDEEQKILENTQNDEEVHRVTKQDKKHIMYILKGGKNLKVPMSEVGGSTGAAYLYYVCLDKTDKTVCSLENACDYNTTCGVDGELCTAQCTVEPPEVSGPKVCLGTDIVQCPTSMRMCETNEDCNINGESCYDPCGVDTIDKQSCNCAVY